MKKLLILLFFGLSTGFAFENQWRGKMIYFQDHFNDGLNLERLQENGFTYLLQSSGKIVMNSNGSARLLGLTHDKDEEKFKKRYAFNNYLVYELEDPVLLFLEQGSSSFKKNLATDLLAELQYYGRKFDGVVFKTKNENIPTNLDFTEILQAFRNKEYKLGFQLPAKNLEKEELRIRKNPCDFLIAALKAMELKKHTFMKAMASFARIPRPFFTMLKLDTERLNCEGQGCDEKLSLVHLEERENKDHPLGLYRSYQSPGNMLSLQVIEKTQKAFQWMDKLSLKLPHFYFSGVGVNLHSWNVKTIFGENKIAPPKLVQNIQTKGNHLILELKLVNPNPVPSSSGGAGIGIKLRGYSLKKLSLGAFEGMETKKLGDTDMVLFSRSQLGPFEDSGVLRVELQASGLEPDRELSGLAWMAAKGQGKTILSDGSKQNSLLEFALYHKARPLVR